ncbi:MAG: tetratricopeptide repeat protein [Gammaproteobacteria bacterium]|nr:tetratricopeptide repeat protein [Gammaproteobacteria bacterium]MYE30166.1 tetratricopeptide repeat protein [Gammaproteobacteria bacterium]MYI01758.1 tetratricopeptide repeat protein [Gammaproteobacteria bacterium]
MSVSMLRASLSAGTIVLLAACASESGIRVAETSAVEPPAQAPVEAPAPVEYGNFTSDQLFQAISGELSAQRGDLEQAAEIYFDLATETRDVGIIERAVQFSSAIGDGRSLLELGLLWAQAAPDVPEPHLLLAFQLLEAGRPGQALSHMEQVLEAGGSFEFSILASATGGIGGTQRSELIAGLLSLKERYPENRSIRIALVQLLAQNQEFAAALTEFEQMSERAELTPDLVRLHAQLHTSVGQNDGALEALRAGLERFPEDRELRLTYARLLLQQRELEAAREQFGIMLAQAPDDWEILLSTGLLDLETENYESAIGIFEQTLAAGMNEDDSHFYLGYANQQLGDVLAAIEHFRQVRQGVDNFLPAQQQATRLSIQLGQFEEAHDWLAQLSRGSSRLEVQFISMESAILLQEGYPERAGELLDLSLNRYPNHADLLFSRVFVHDAVGDMAGSEADLQQIIRMQPDNARALNHLGYMLADRTERYEEALELIERAIALEPEDPAIIDSLGWAQYKLGILEEALENLRRAYAAFPDHEVAAHLGEVLWALDRREEAEQIWEEALAENPESEYVLPTMERLKGRP